ncbi:hypothetical protein G7092_10270 [Mucilaginibacter sp. HC2]|uniref:hypothetical protein n=1 Tax=Mucilaginibacter inviolabilis TaxID=2714892 RepID=UPI00140C53EB|nr:hypothetical protein [Mucilaginibacter inviolabilis]NHA04182.1 hypothetical protein [Mucilaginibacter inviolabilis]
MKQSFIILSILFIITGCAAQKLPYTIGMSEADFNANKSRIDLVEATAKRTIYKRDIEYDNRPGGTMKPTASMYYYFVEGKLVRMERVEIVQQPAVVIPPPVRG